MVEPFLISLLFVSCESEEVKILADDFFVNEFLIRRWFFIKGERTIHRLYKHLVQGVADSNPDIFFDFLVTTVHRRACEAGGSDYLEKNF